MAGGEAALTEAAGVAFPLGCPARGVGAGEAWPPPAAAERVWATCTGAAGACGAARGRTTAPWNDGGGAVNTGLATWGGSSGTTVPVPVGIDMIQGFMAAWAWS